MLGSEFLNYLNKFQVHTYVGIEDFADRFHFLFTVIILLICTMLVATRQYVLSPISCYVATKPEGFNILDFIENYCWVEGTIPVSSKSVLPDENTWKQYTKITYYQWVPFMLSTQCIICYLPRLIWQLICYNRTGTDIQHLIISANQAVHSSEEARIKMVQYVARSIEQLLYQHREYRTGRFTRFRRYLFRKVGPFMPSKRFGTWLLIGYFICKLLYILSTFFQLLIIQRLLSFKESTNLWNFGWEISQNLWKGKDWRQTLIFPRVTFCPVYVWNLGAKNFVLAQCVLPINMLNEHIYIFLWFWLLVGMAVCVISMLIWGLRMVWPKSRRRFLKKLLHSCGEVSCIPEHDTNSAREFKMLIRKFETQFLRHDGIFLVRMISINAGDIVASDILGQLWRIFKSTYVNRNLLNDSIDPNTESAGVLLRLDGQKSSLPERVSPSAPPRQK